MTDYLHLLFSNNKTEMAKCNLQCEGADNIKIYKQHGVDWQEEHSSTTVIFASSEELKNCESLKKSGYFCEEFWQVIQDDLNGSFHYKYAIDDEDEMIGHESWSCFNIKKVNKASGSPETHYSWLQVTVFVQFHLKTGNQVVFFLNLPAALERQVQKSLSSTHKDNPFLWHTILTQQAKLLYNDAVWSIRDLVRSVEKTRNVDPPPVSNFPKLHDTARHVSHANEILEIAEHTVHRVIQEQITWRTEYANRSGKNRLLWVQNEQDLRFFAKEIHSLKIRSRSLSERMQNEINLAFNLVSQRHGRNAQGDSAMMKTIAVVSLVYLPGTFVSGLFGTNFFDLSTSNGTEQAWTVSGHFWLYWAITIPLTFATVIVWAIWHFSNRGDSPRTLHFV